MDFTCRLIPLLFLSLSLLAPATQARTSRFDIDELSLYIPCLEVLRNGTALGANGSPVMYEVLMSLEGSRFAVTDLQELESADECLATFDLATNMLEDQVRHQDKIFDVVLHHESNLRFSPGSVSFRERGTTSLWRVSHGENEIFLGGTIHILNIEDFPLPDQFREALFQSSVLYTETAYEETSGSGGESEPHPAENPDGTLTQILQPATLVQLNAFLAARGVTIEPIDHLLPYVAGRALVELGIAADGFGPGVDYFFTLVAQNLDLPVLGLETAASQLDAVGLGLEGVTPDDIILSALFTAQNSEYREYLDFIITVWREGDIEYFEWANDQTKAEDEKYYNAVLRDRNLAWLPQIETMLVTPEVEMVLVGVGHLAGDDNILELLEAAGYTIERYR